MLTSSRARWRPVITGIIRRNTVHSQKTRNLGAAVARPVHPTAARDVIEERIQRILTGRNTFRNYGTSPQSLQLLVEETKYDEANTMILELRSRRIQVRPHPVYLEVIHHLLSQQVLGHKDHEVLELWFDLLPDVRGSNSALLQRVSNDLRRHMTANTTFTMLAGRALARKGYGTLVEEIVLPVARRSLGLDVFMPFEQELLQSLAKSLARATSVGSTPFDSPEVFEDASEDYASILATSSPPPPSVLEIVEATLPQTLPTPDPVHGSVFEDETDEDYVTHRHLTSHSPRQSPADQLCQLVESERYEDALHLLTELQHLHIRVPFSHLFGAAALSALRKPFSEDYTSENQLKLFSTWFSLIPPAHEAPGANHLQVIQRTITQASITNIPLIMRFCVVLANKGYAAMVGRQELAVVMRFASSDVVQQHVRELESAYSDYWNMYQPEKAQFESTHFSGRIRSNAVRYLAYSGKVEDALALVPARGSKVRLSLFTYDKLLRTLRDTSRPVPMQSIEHIRSLRAEIIGTGPQAKIRHMPAVAEDTMMAAELHTASADVGTKTLPETLRYLKRALRRAQDNPHPFIIAEFLERYLATGRTQAPTLLLNLATRMSYHSTSILLFAEMLYYRRLGQHQLIIRAFVDHFYISGVPREDVIHVYNSTSKNSTSYSYCPEDHVSLTRICNFDPSTHLPRGKAWPMKIHCNLIWQTLVALTPEDFELEILYTKLLNLARGKDLTRSLPHVASLSPLLPPPSWESPVGHAAFTPFMRRLMSSTGPGRGTQIINDMLSLDIQPSVYHFTELAGYYAKMGQVEPTMILLHNLESSSGLLERLKRQQLENEGNPQGLASSPSHASLSGTRSSKDSGTNPQSNQADSIPEPDLAFYTAVMRGFLISESIPGFERVHKRLLVIRNLLPEKRFNKDQEAVLNQVYTDFRALSQKQGYDWGKQRKTGYWTWLENEKRKKKGG